MTPENSEGILPNIESYIQTCRAFYEDVRGGEKWGGGKGIRFWRWVTGEEVDVCGRNPVDSGNQATSAQMKMDDPSFTKVDPLIFLAFVRRQRRQFPWRRHKWEFVRSWTRCWRWLVISPAGHRHKPHTHSWWSKSHAMTIRHAPECSEDKSIAVDQYIFEHGNGYGKSDVLWIPENRRLMSKLNWNKINKNLKQDSKYHEQTKPIVHSIIISSSSEDP
jgi:hypothetical protein